MNTNTPSVLIVEDSAVQSKILRACVEQMKLRVFGQVDTAAAALQLCSQELPTLAIVDIEITGQTDGVELARELQQRGPIAIIFASGVDDPAIWMRIQEVQPLAFLPKPYTIVSLRRVIELGVYGEMRTPIEPSIPQPAVLPPQVPWLFVRERNLLVRVAIEDILCVQMDSKYCLLTLTSGRSYSVRTSLVQLLHHLGAGFAQVHRSWLVQLKHIEAVDPAMGTIRLLATAEAPLGRAYREELMGRLQLLD